MTWKFPDLTLLNADAVKLNTPINLTTIEHCFVLFQHLMSFSERRALLPMCSNLHTNKYRYKVPVDEDMCMGLKDEHLL